MQQNSNLIICTILLTFIFIFILGGLNQSDLPYDNFEDVVLFDDGWQYCIDGGEFLPCDSPSDITGEEGDVIVFKNTFPKIASNYDSLQFNASRSFIKVYLEDELVYNLDESNLHLVGKSPGNMTLFIELPDVQVGDEIMVEYRPVYSVAEINKMYLSSQVGGLYDMLRNEMTNFILSSLMTIFGLVQIAVYIFAIRKRDAIHILHLGFFTLLAGTYTATVLPMLLIFISEPYIVSVASYLLLSLLAVPILFYLCSASKLRYDKHLYVLIALHLIYWVFLIVMQVFNIMDVREPIRFFHILLGFSLAAVILTSAYEILIVKNKQLYTFAIAGVSLSVFSGIDLITYYLANESYKSMFFQVGVLSFSAILFLGYMRDIAEILKENARAKLYQKLAYEDILTDVKNRTCFEKDFEPFKNGEQDAHNLAIGIFDINNLKKINDTLGHKYGDELIINASKALKATFLDCAEIYRIGGDEFSLISTQITEKKIGELLTKLQKNIDELNSTSEFELSIASDLCLFDATIDQDVDELFKRVDLNMYNRKKEMKSIQ